MDHEKSSTGVSIVIPYRNRQQTLPLALASIQKAWERLDAERRSRLEVIVVDDASDPPFAAKQPGALVPLVVRFDENRGAGTARNTGLWEARQSHVLFLDSDVLIEESYLERLFGRLEADSGIRVLQGHHSPKPANPNPGWFAVYMALSWYHIAVSSSPQNVAGWPYTSCAAFDARFLRELGGITCRIPGTGGEEYELASRLPRGCIRCDWALVTHHYYDTLAARLRKLFGRGSNFISVIGKNPMFPVEFRRRSAVNAVLSVLALASWFVAPVSLEAAVLLYAGFSLVLALVTDGKLTRYLASEHSLAMAVASVVFRQLEYATIGLGMVYWILFKKTAVTTN